MSQQKKPAFDLYPLLTERFIAYCRRSFPGKFGKSASDQKIVQDFYRERVADGNDQTVHIMAEEFFMKRMGCQVIFPESSVVMDNLLKARYTMESVEGFKLPFASFILAPPRGYAFKGVKIPSLLVSWTPKGELGTEMLYPFLDHYGIPKTTFTLLDRAEDDVLSIVYNEPTGHEKNRTYLSAPYIPMILAAKNPDDYRDIMVKQGFIAAASQLADHDSMVQFYAFKLIAALGVYHQATHGEKLRSGFPSGLAPRLDGWRPEQKMAPLTLSNSMPPLDDSDATRAAHYRSWYFRQLRADRYYKGDYAHYAPGSRYSFVQETMVKLDATPNTQA